MSKQKLLLSVAAVAILTSPALADTTVKDSQSKGYITGALANSASSYDKDSYNGENNGSITLLSTGAIKPSASDTISGIVVNSNKNYVYSNGLIQANGKDSAFGIQVDMSTKVDGSYARNMAGGGLISTEGGTALTVPTAIYLDSKSQILLAGDSGTTKYGIWLNGADSSCFSSGVSSCVVTGDITMASGSSINLKGSSVEGMYFEYGTVLQGNLNIAGTIEAHAQTNTSTSTTGQYGIYAVGNIIGDVKVASTGTVLTEGAGSYAMFLSGSGVTGALTIEGKVIAQGIDPSSSHFSQSKADDASTTYPEGGVALAVGASVTKGINISGTVSTLGTGEAIYISPGLSYGSSSYSPVQNLVIGYSGTSGYGFNNSGTINLSPVNTNISATAAVYLVGGGSRYPSVINGGILNSGMIQTVVRNSTDTPTSVSGSAIVTSGYFNIGGYFDGTKYNADTVTASSSCASGYCYFDGNSTTVDATTRGSLTNTGTIRVITGTDSAGKPTNTGAAAVRGITIAANSHLTSIVNTGTILASATVKSDRTDDVTALAAVAIADSSGTLTYIYNSGTIAANVTTLDNDAQSGIAISLAGSPDVTTINGATIINKATSGSSALILGDIYFGDGNNEKLIVEGFDATHTASVIGDISFGASNKPGASNGDLITIGNYGTVTGKITATNDVAIDIKSGGTLNLLNDKASLSVSNLTVENGATLSIGVSKDMNKDGTIDASGDVSIATGANLKVTYNSFVPAGNNADGSSTFLLVRANAGHMQTPDLTVYNSQISSGLPFLFDNASMSKITSSDHAYDELILTVAPKTASELKLSGYASQMFPYINTALNVDPDLSAAMVNDIGDGCGTIVNGACSGKTTLAQAEAQAQKAYNAFAPNMTGATRAIGISLTDQATSVVSARQRALRNMARNADGDATFWMQGFGDNSSAHGQGTIGSDGSHAQSGYKQKGFGVALGYDQGSPRFGWYGGALTFYNANVQETDRDSHENQLWVLLSGYSTWRGQHLFFDSKVDVGYARTRGKRVLSLSDTAGNTYVREADSTHATELVSGGVTTGAQFDWAGLVLAPQVSLDGMLMRAEGYSEKNPDSTLAARQGFLLHLDPGYSQSLRGYAGTSLRYDFRLFGITWQPEVHGGYRYDFLNDANKSRVSFKDINTDVSGSQRGSTFTLYGLDPSRGNLVGGAGFGFNTGSWSLGVSADIIRGSNGVQEKAGTLNFVARL